MVFGLGYLAAGPIGGLLSLAIVSSRLVAQDRPVAASSAVKDKTSAASVLTQAQWKRLDRAVDRALVFLSRSQEADGSFPTIRSAQPGVTSLCVMAFLARGHQPGKGPYGPRIERAIDYALDLQDRLNGAIMADQSSGTGGFECGNYNHGISGVMLGEVYGMTGAKRHARIRSAIVKGLEYIRKQQLREKPAEERGGWRYVGRSGSNNSDLSVTAWQLMFYRSARNAEFNVPEDWVKDAMAYVHRSFDENERAFVYALFGGNRYCTRGMAGAGIVSLALGGEHQSASAKMAGDWILQHSFEPYNNFRGPEDRYHYGAFYCSQAMYQLGGEYWRRFFPSLLAVLAEAQNADGSWAKESVGEDGEFGNAYTTSLAVLALSPPYQILPIYQR